MCLCHRFELLLIPKHRLRTLSLTNKAIQKGKRFLQLHWLTLNGRGETVSKFNLPGKVT